MKMKPLMLVEKGKEGYKVKTHTHLGLACHARAAVLVIKTWRVGMCEKNIGISLPIFSGKHPMSAMSSQQSPNT